MATEISYNGAVIGSLETGQTATLACAGKKAVGNIVVAFDGAGNITHNGSTTEVEAGKTATLQCAGKKMNSDVYVTVEKVDIAKELVGTWILNELLKSPAETFTVHVSGLFYGCSVDSGRPSEWHNLAYIKADSHYFKLNEADDVLPRFWTWCYYNLATSVCGSLIDTTSSSTSWKDATYPLLKQFDIYSLDDDTDADKLLAYLQANATKQ